MQIERLQYSLLLYLCLFGSKTHLSAAESGTYSTRFGLKIKPEYITDQVNGVSRIACAVIFQLRPPCRSVSWSKSLHQCLLSERDEMDVSVIRKLQLPSTSEALEVASEWITMSILRFPVIAYEGTNGTYTLTYNQAAQLCSSFNTSLATYDQLLEAWKMGLQHCAWGWLSDGSAGYPMQEKVAGCGDKVGVVFGRPGSNNKCNAWCSFY